jgi:amidophosphoribosyltransferase
MATKGQLIAAHRTVDEIRSHIEADSLGYLSLDGTAAATGSREDQLCTACFSGSYPSAVPLQLDKFLLESEPERDRHALPVAATGL